MANNDDSVGRRAVLGSLLLGILPLELSAIVPAAARARPLSREQTVIWSPGQLAWTSPPGYPARSVDHCRLTGDPHGTGLYYMLVRWWPGYMSAPHHYTSDAFCMVLSGTWWCNTSAEFDPATSVPVGAGSFVRRVADVPQYDGVISTATQPAIIAVCGAAPVHYALVDPSRPGWRQI